MKKNKATQPSPDEGEEDKTRSNFLFPFVKGKEMPWKDKIVPEYIIPFIAERRRQGSKPNVRGIGYYLETMRIVPKNDLTSGRLGRALSNARRGYLNRRTGVRGPATIPMNALADNTRHTIKDFEDKERSLEDYIQDAITELEDLPNGFKTKAPRWLDQPIYVEVWVEKQNMAPDVRKALKGRHVVIAPNRGSVSITFIHQNIERLIDQFIEHKRKKVYVLYLGDADPDGWDMDRRAIEDLTRQTKESLSAEELKDEQGDARFVFKRIAITDEQIKKFKKIRDLKQTDPDTLKKLWKHRNLAERFKKHFGSVFQIELEALQLLSFKTFKKLITDEVDKLYDDTIYQDVIKRPEWSQEPREIKDQIIIALNLLMHKLSKKDEDEQEEEVEEEEDEEQ